VGEAWRRTKSGLRAGPRPLPASHILAPFQIVFHPHGAGVPTGSAKPAENRSVGKLFIDMKGLRIVFAAEGLDLVGLEGVTAENDGLADTEIVVQRHDCASGSRSRNIPTFSSSMTSSPRW